MPKKTAAARSWRNPRFAPTPGARRIRESLLLGAALRRKSRRGCVLGTFVIELPTAASVTALAVAGFDFIVLDMEHSVMSFDALEPLLLAARAAGICTLVRPFETSAGAIGKILDMGANGIMAPHVNDVARARDIVASARFPPLGQRGFSPLARYDSLQQPVRELNDSTYVVVQIEGRAGVDQVAEIASIPGIDAMFVGPYDLALSLGVEPGSPGVIETARRIAASASPPMTLGIYVDDPRSCGTWAARGFGLQCVSFDGRIYSDSARAVLGHARAAVATTKTTRARSRS